MRRVIWSLAAREDLKRIRSYLHDFNPGAAERVALALLDAAESLTQLADRGRPALAGSRELVAVWPYVIRYRPTRDAVFILRVRHGAQRPD